MKNRLTHYLQTITLFLLLLCTTSGCTHNNGDIGDLFGTWRLQSFTSSNYVLDDTKEYYLLFQGKVFCMKIVNPQAYTVVEAYGSFEEQEESQLTLDFKEDESNVAPRVGFDESPITIQLTISGSRMTLTAQDQTTWVYEKHG